MPIPYRCQLQFIQQNRHSIRSLKNRLSISQSDLPQLPISIQEQTPLPEQSLQPLSDRPNTRLHNTRRHNQETPQGAGGRAGRDFRIRAHSGVRTEQGEWSVVQVHAGLSARSISSTCPPDNSPCSVRPQSQEPDRRLLSVPCLTASNDFGNAEQGDAILTISFLWL